MGRPAIPAGIQNEIQSICLSEMELTGKEVLDKLQANHKGEPLPKIRAVQRVISEARAIARIRSDAADAHGYPITHPMSPWADNWPKQPKEIALAFEMLKRSRKILGCDLNEEVFSWTKKLHDLFTLGESRIDAALDRLAVISFLYAWQEYLCRWLEEDGAKPYTPGLDSYLSWAPWRSPGNSRAYLLENDVTWLRETVVVNWPRQPRDPNVNYGRPHKWATILFPYGPAQDKMRKASPKQ